MIKLREHNKRPYKELEKALKDPWGKWYDNPVCPECGSKNVVAF